MQTFLGHFAVMIKEQAIISVYIYFPMVSVYLRHRLRPIDTHLALYTMLYNNSAKNRYAEPVLNKTKQISKIRD